MRIQLWFSRQEIEEAAEPAFFEDAFVRLGPDAELFAVVGEHGDGVGMSLGDVAEVVDGVLRRAEGNHVAQPLAAGDDADHVGRRPR